MSLLMLTGFGVARRNHSILRGVDLVIGAGGVGWHNRHERCGENDANACCLGVD